MKRLATEFLKNWYTKQSRKPLVIRGARQVGKTELVRIFCKEQKLDLIEINFEQYKISEFQKEDRFDVNRALNEILALANKNLSENSLIFIDEIQEIPKAYERLRFFKEQIPELPLIVAGSTLELAIRLNKLKAPVGRVEYLFLGPMTFSEFLLARKKERIFEEITNIHASATNTISESIHDQCIDLYREYLFVGGMPEAVRVFCEGNGNYNFAREIHKQIIQSYGEDIKKYTTGKLAKVISEVFEKFPSHIGEKNKFSNLSHEKSTYTSEAIDLLEQIYYIQKVFHANCAGFPLKQGEKKDIFKIYHLDVGLYNAQLGLSWAQLAHLNHEQLVTKGKIAEQFIAQHLLWGRFKTENQSLNYWLRDQSTQKAELDFIIENDVITPIEVKSGKIGKIKSLTEFMVAKQKLAPKPIRFDLKYREKFEEQCHFFNATKKEVKFVLLNYPLYCVEFVFAGF